MLSVSTVSTFTCDKFMTCNYIRVKNQTRKFDCIAKTFFELKDIRNSEKFSLHNPLVMLHDLKSESALHFQITLTKQRC